MVIFIIGKCQNSIQLQNNALTPVGAKSPSVACLQQATLHLFQTGFGTKSKPYIICNREQLQNINFSPDVSYKLGNNIDLNNENWLPLGSTNDFSQGFKGTFDGDNYTILNLKLAHKNAVSIGLFGVINHDQVIIENLILDTVNIDFYSNNINIGSLIGSVKNISKVENITVKNITIQHMSQHDPPITSTHYSLGGLIGFLACSVSCTNINTSIKNINILKMQNSGKIDINDASLTNTDFQMQYDNINYNIGGLIGRIESLSDSSNPIDIIITIQDIFIDVNLSVTTKEVDQTQKYPNVLNELNLAGLIGSSRVNVPADQTTTNVNFNNILIKGNLEANGYFQNMIIGGLIGLNRNYAWTRNPVSFYQNYSDIFSLVSLKASALITYLDHNNGNSVVYVYNGADAKRFSVGGLVGILRHLDIDSLANFRIENSFYSGDIELEALAMNSCTTATCYDLKISLAGMIADIDYIVNNIVPVPEITLENTYSIGNIKLLNDDVNTLFNVDSNGYLSKKNSFVDIDLRQAGFIAFIQEFFSVSNDTVEYTPLAIRNSYSRMQLHNIFDNGSMTRYKMNSPVSSIPIHSSSTDNYFIEQYNSANTLVPVGISNTDYINNHHVTILSYQDLFFLDAITTGWDTSTWVFHAGFPCLKGKPNMANVSTNFHEELCF